MGINDWLRLMHPILAVSVVFPLIGMVSYFALQTRNRRLAVQAKEKSKIPPVVGKEHVNLGRWLTGAVVGLTLVGVGHPIIKNIVAHQPIKEFLRLIFKLICFRKRLFYSLF